MCGVLAVLGPPLPESILSACLRALRARGPDGPPSSFTTPAATLAFTRLAINGLTSAGAQPSQHGEISWICNGEIYNHHALAAAYGLDLPAGCSDCGVLGALWTALDGDAVAFTRALDGVFALVLIDAARGLLVVARDGFGVRPLFEATVDAAAAAPVGEPRLAPAPAALAARVEAWAGAPPAVRALPPPLVDSTVACAQRTRRVWASELRGLLPAVADSARAATAGSGWAVAPFPPGVVRTFALETGALLRDEVFFTVPWIKQPLFGGVDGAAGPSPGGDLPTGDSDVGTAAHENDAAFRWPPALRAGARRAHAAVRATLTEAVEKRLLSDVRVGAMLSGGLDSSLVAALAARALRSRSAPPLATFSIGMPGSADVAAARLVAEHIGSEHHEIIVSEADMLTALPEVVAAIESFDITSVRASVGNYLLAKYVRLHTNVRVLLNGDGADELSGSYLYFKSAPSDGAFEAEVARLLRDIHLFDVLRSDRCVAAWGLEARTPFLDKQFAATYLSVATDLRRPRVGGAVEKQLLREAFASSTEPLLPDAVLWRRKEAFSDGVSTPEKSWFEVITAHVADVVFAGQGEEPTAPWRVACAIDRLTPPFTRESLYYRELFEAALAPGAAACIPYFWLPKWSGGARDPSARTLAVYDGE